MSDTFTPEQISVYLKCLKLIKFSGKVIISIDTGGTITNVRPESNLKPPDLEQFCADVLDKYGSL